MIAVKHTDVDIKFSCQCGETAGILPCDEIVPGCPVICCCCGRLHILEGDLTVRRMCREEGELILQTPWLKAEIERIWMTLGCWERRLKAHPAPPLRS